MGSVMRAIRGSLAPSVDAHSASFLGRTVSGMPGPVWSLVAWNTVMALITVSNAIALGISHDVTPIRLAAASYWIVTAVLVRFTAARTPNWVIHLLLDLNIVVISLSAATSVNDARAAASMVFLVLPAVYAATWMDRQRMGLHLIVLLAASGAVAIVLGRNPDIARAWISVVAVSIGLAYFVNALVDHLNRQAIIDPLTGLLNRTGLDMVLATQERDGRPQPRAVAVLDLDGFKAVNDARGHAGGDALLRDVGAVLRAGLRPNDTVVRTGGDEFLVVLTRTERPQAAEVIERVRDALPIGCSVGIADWPADVTLDEALHRADQDMYRDKARRKGGPAPIDAH